MGGIAVNVYNDGANEFVSHLKLVKKRGIKILVPYSFPKSYFLKFRTLIPASFALSKIV